MVLYVLGPQVTCLSVRMGATLYWKPRLISTAPGSHWGTFFKQHWHQFQRDLQNLYSLCSVLEKSCYWNVHKSVSITTHSLPTISFTGLRTSLDGKRSGLRSLTESGQPLLLKLTGPVPRKESTVPGWWAGSACWWDFFFWPHNLACGILVPRPGIQPAPPASERQSLNYWLAGEVPSWWAFDEHRVTSRSHAEPISWGQQSDMASSCSHAEQRTG